VCLFPEVYTRHLPNTKQEWLPLGHNIWQFVKVSNSWTPLTVTFLTPSSWLRQKRLWRHGNLRASKMAACEEHLFRPWLWMHPWQWHAPRPSAVSLRDVLIYCEYETTTNMSHCATDLNERGQCGFPD
jgi:hypothetical protein